MAETVDHDVYFALELAADTPQGRIQVAEGGPYASVSEALSVWASVGGRPLRLALRRDDWKIEADDAAPVDVPDHAPLVGATLCTVIDGATVDSSDLPDVPAPSPAAMVAPGAAQYRVLVAARDMSGKVRLALEAGLFASAEAARTWLLSLTSSPA